MLQAGLLLGAAWFSLTGYLLWSQCMLTACQAPPWEWHKAAAQEAWRSRSWLVAQRTVAQAVAPAGELPLSAM